MKIKVTKEQVVLEEVSSVFSGEFGVNECEFSLPECFDGLNVTAVFNNIPVPLVNNRCIIPSLDEGAVILGAYAYKKENDNLVLMYSPKPTVFYVAKGSFSHEENQEAKPDISLYEQYCNMIKNEFEALSGDVLKNEAERQKAESDRESIFKINEINREKVFDFNEIKRNSSVVGAYKNLLADLQDSSADESFPATFPCVKKGYNFNNETNNFQVSSVADSYVFKTEAGDRFNVSGFEPQIAAGLVCHVLDENGKALLSASILNSRDALGGTFPMPEGAEYIVLVAVKASNAPYITKVSEPVIETNNNTVPVASKFVSCQMNGDYHLCYDGEEGAFLISKWGLASYKYYSNGLYPLKQGVEYVVYMPEINKENQYYKLLFFCNDNFKITKVVNHTASEKSFDDNCKFVFTATEDDCYLAINSLGFNGSFQFGESKSQNIFKSVKVGNAEFDGKHNIAINDMGIIDRSLYKKFIAYGDSITLGAGIDYANGVKRWTDYIAQRYNIPVHINMGVGYSSLAMNEKYSELPMSHDERLSALINESPDIVTILGGANDYIFNVPIGTDEDVKNKNRYTFKGAYAYIIDAILSVKPDTTILLLGMYLNTKGAYSEGKGAYPLKEYRKATKEISEYFGLPFIDLNECGFNDYNFNTSNGIYSTDGIHPNAEGTKRIAMLVSKWFDSFNGTIY